MKSLDLFMTSSVCKLYYNETEGLAITDVGYNDFRNLEGLNVFRKQQGCTLHCIISGKGKLDFRGKTYYPKEGDLFILPPNEEFKYIPDKENPWRYLWFGFIGKEAESLITTLLDLYKSPVISNVEETTLSETVGGLISSLSIGEDVGYYKVLSSFYALIDELLRDKQNKNITDSISRDRIIALAIENIQLNAYNPDITIEIICHMTHVSHSYLCRLFKKEKNISIKDYLTSVRMSRALKLCSASNMTIREIAFMSGYSDEINFMKAFKKYYGYTCSHFRKGN